MSSDVKNRELCEIQFLYNTERQAISAMSFTTLDVRLHELMSCCVFNDTDFGSLPNSEYTTDRESIYP